VSNNSVHFPPTYSINLDTGPKDYAK